VRWFNFSSINVKVNFKSWDPGFLVELDVNTLFDDEAQAQVSVWICIILMNILRNFNFIKTSFTASHQTSTGVMKSFQNESPTIAQNVSKIYYIGICKTL